MGKGNEKVILFPKWKMALEQESLQALKDKQYEQALVKLNQLIDYHTDNHEIYIGKLICLMELGEYAEAEDLCESRMGLHDHYYYHYVHIYLTILFQTNQYLQLIEQIDTEFSSGNIPEQMREKFQQLYDISVEMYEEVMVERTIHDQKELKEAVEQQDHAKQWRIINGMYDTNGKPSKLLESMLVDETIHPVVKTAIVRLYRKKNISEEIIIQKLGKRQHIVPVKIPSIDELPIILEIKRMNADVEQKNPSLANMMETMLYHYMYVCYPIIPDIKNSIHIARALKVIAGRHMNDEHAEERQIDDEAIYIEQIELYEALYLSILSE